MYWEKKALSSEYLSGERGAKAVRSYLVSRDGMRVGERNIAYFPTIMEVAGRLTSGREKGRDS